MSKTKIEWADLVWNPVTGCTKVSDGCRYCYAETQAKRFWGERKFTDVQCHEDRLEMPLKWKKPRRVFVNSMSDLFHPDIPDSFIGKVFFVMRMAKQHTFMVLTKRPERMNELLSNVHGEFWQTIYLNCLIKGQEIKTKKIKLEISTKELKNVWLGVSVEDQKSADKRVPLLIETPAALHFVSCEPLLGPVDVREWLHGFTSGIDWVIVGGESGPFARPMHPDWVKFLRNMCEMEKIPFFFKQWGEWQWTDERIEAQRLAKGEGEQKLSSIEMPGAIGYRKEWFNRVGKKKAGRELDGRTWDEFPGGVTVDEYKALMEGIGEPEYRRLNLGGWVEFRGGEG